MFRGSFQSEAMSQNAKPVVCCQVMMPSTEEILGPYFELIRWADLEKDPELIPKIDGVILRPVSRELIATLRQMRNLKAISVYGVGYEMYYNTLKTLGVPIANCPASSSISTANFAMTLLLAVAHDLPNRMKEGRVQSAKTPHSVTLIDDVCGKTLGLVGFGNIGKTVAKRARGFDMNVLYHCRHRRYVDEDIVGAKFCGTLHEMLPKCDYVIIACTLTPETEMLFGSKEFQLMRPTAAVINIATGKIIDQDALVDALKSNQIHAAALDVTDPQPLPREHELLQLPNVLLTPHTGGFGSLTGAMGLQMHLDNLRSLLIEGKAMPHEIHPDNC